MIILWTHRSRALDKKDPTLLSRQSRAAPAPRQVAHPRPNSAEISSSDGGTQ
jgi:hypothetical protein